MAPRAILAGWYGPSRLSPKRRPDRAFSSAVAAGWAFRICPDAEVMMLPRPLSSIGWMKRLMTRRLPKTWVANMRSQSATSVSSTVTLPWESR